MKRKIALVLSALLILCVFAACNKMPNATVNVPTGIISEKTDPAIKFLQDRFSAAMNYYCGTNPIAYSSSDNALVYHGKDKPENLRFSIKASDGYFTDRDMFGDIPCIRFETRDDLTTEDRFYWDNYSRDYVVIGEHDYEYKDKTAGEFYYKDSSIETYFKGDSVFLETVIYDGDTIIGYGVAKICAAPQIPASEIEEGMESIFRVYMPIEIESAVFPKIDGEYQKVSAEYVQKLIDNAKEAGKDIAPAGLNEYLKNKDL